MFTEDFSAYMNLAEFATSVTLSGVTVAAIFDNAHALGSVGAYGMAAAGPVLLLASADVPAEPIGLAAVVSGTSYLVVAHEPDGTGVSRLILELA